MRRTLTVTRLPSSEEEDDGDAGDQQSQTEEDDATGEEGDAEGVGARGRGRAGKGKGKPAVKVLEDGGDDAEEEGVEEDAEVDSVEAQRGPRASGGGPSRQPGCSLARPPAPPASPVPPHSARPAALAPPAALLHASPSSTSLIYIPHPPRGCAVVI